MNQIRLERWEIEQLLPWRAAGSLNRSETEEVDAALAHDPELMRRYMLAREELSATVELNDSLGEPSQGTMHRLFATIDAQSRGRNIHLAEKIGQLLGGLTARQIAFACIGAVLVLSLGLAGGIVIGEHENRVAQTAGADKAAVAGYAIVRFASGASIESISALLAANRATVVDGPSADGLYRVRIAALPKDTVYRGIENGSSGEQQRDHAIANIRAAAGVVQFAAAQP